MINILYISYGTGIYGANRALLNLILYLRLRALINPIVLVRTESEFTVELTKHKIKYISSNFTNCVYRAEDKKYKIQTVKNYIFNIYRVIKNQYWNYRCLYSIKDIIAKEQIELIHSNTSIINIGIFISKKLKIKHIFHFREFGAEDYNLKFIYGNCIAAKYIRSNSDALIAVSNAVANKYSTLCNREIITIYDGIYSKFEFINKKETILKNSNSIQIVIVGLVHPGKGQIIGIKAVDYLIKEYNMEGKIMLHIIGNSDELYLNELKIYIKSAGIEKYIKFWGHRNDVNKIRKSMDIAVMCSNMEAFGLVTIEAMLARLPVVGANSGGTREIICNGKTGLLFEPNDHIDLAKKLLILINNPPLRSEFGNNGYENVSKLYSQENCAKKIHSIYNKLVNKNLTAKSI